MREATITRTALALILLATLSVSGRSSENSPLLRVVPELVAGDLAREDRDTSQFLAADAKGRIFLLHGDTREVDQLLPSGKIVVWRAPRDNQKAAGSDPAIDAVMKPDGGSWLLFFASDRLALLDGDDLRDLPAAHWLVSALAYTDDGPVIAVLPATAGGPDAGAPVSREAWDNPPLLLRLHDQAWQTMVAQEPLRVVQEDRAAKPTMSIVKIKEDRDTRLAAGPRGALWVAQQNAYLLRRYSGFGALEESVTVGGGHVRRLERSEEEWKVMEKVAQGEAMKLDRAALGKMHAVRVVRGMTAQDNRVYLFVETEQGPALDRWDTETQVLDRLLLGEIASGRSYQSLAAGRDGLYIAARGLGEPVWRLDWQRLADAKWKPVPEAVAQHSPPDKRPGAGQH